MFVLFDEFLFKSQKHFHDQGDYFCPDFILFFQAFLQLLGQNTQTCCNGVKHNNDKRKAMNALNPDCQKRPLKMTGNEIKCLSHFQLCSKIFLAIRHNYQVSELCRGLHAWCLVVPATVTFQTIQQIFQLQNDQSFIQSSGSMEKHGCDSDFSFLKNVNCGHLKKPNLPKYPRKVP